MIIKEVSKDFWRLETGTGDERLIWYGHSRTEVRSKFMKWIRDNNNNTIGEVTRRRCTPTRVASHLAHLE